MQLIYNVSISAVQQSDSVIYVYIYIYVIFCVLFCKGSSQDFGYSSLYYRVGPCPYILHVIVFVPANHELDFTGSALVKNLPANAGDVGSFPGLGTVPGEGSGNLLQCSCLENPMNRGDGWATADGVAESRA